MHLREEGLGLSKGGRGYSREGANSGRLKQTKAIGVNVGGEHKTLAKALRAPGGIE